MKIPKIIRLDPHLQCNDVLSACAEALRHSTCRPACIPSSERRPSLFSQSPNLKFCVGSFIHDLWSHPGKNRTCPSSQLSNYWISRKLPICEGFASPMSCVAYVGSFRGALWTTMLFLLAGGIMQESRSSIQ